MSTIRVAVAILLGLVGIAGPLAAQTYTCQPATGSHALALKDYVVRLTGGDPSLADTRDSYKLPATSASKVTVITTKSTCQAAAQAYHRATRGTTAPAISRSVVVVKVGTTRYVVYDPQERHGEYAITFVFDMSWVPLAGFNS
jgi:hypothetical protein